MSVIIPASLDCYLIMLACVSEIYKVEHVFCSTAEVVAY